MEIYLLRHGVTDWNSTFRIQGNEDIPLNKLGEDMAKETGENLIKDGIIFDKVYSSPLLRARRSAELVAPGKEIIEDNRLREMHFGAQEGMVVTEMAKSDLPFKHFRDDPVKYDELVGGLGDGAETFAMLVKRAGDFIKERIESPTEEGVGRILISGHGALDQAIIFHMKKRDNIMDFWKGGLLPNCGLDIIEYDPKTKEYIFKKEMIYCYSKELFDKAPVLLK